MLSIDGSETLELWRWWMFLRRWASTIFANSLLGLVAWSIFVEFLAADDGIDGINDSASTPSFTAEILPLLKSKCGECHGPTSQKGELALHTPALIQKGSESGAVIVAGKSGKSRLFELVKQGEMPPEGKGKLSDAEVELIRRWIDGGVSFGTDPVDRSPQWTQHDVIPILLLRCTACHGRHRQEGGLDLRSREAMLKGGKSGPAFVPGHSDESLILRRIRAEEMPPHARLTEVSVKPMEPEETRILASWIDAGAPVAHELPDLAGSLDDPLVRPEDKDFWSFRPPRPVSIPQVEEQSLTSSRMDAWILKSLHAAGLTFAPLADRAVLLRRVTFDLTGLPPDPADGQEFSHDARADAFERVVDRLLASPRYGERWASHWLDVAGYSETEGRREQHLPRPFAWRYRDYVIRSLNSDKPYDRFLQEQIAGDELADYERASVITQEMEDQLVATAFLRMAPDPTWANLTGFVPDRLEVTADSMDVLGSGVMGLTFKCARCHSHKFDPIPQRDYYRLVAIFKGAYDEHDWLKPQITGYGGALSSGIGERFLPYVTTEERRRWEQSQAVIQQQLESLAALPKSPETDQRRRELESKRLPEPKIMALWDRGEPSPTYLYRRGNHASPGAFVSPGVPAVLHDASQSFEITPPWPGAKSTGRRLAFARWLTASDHPLTSRVMINRIWKHHFGHGIVRSLGNFGKTGDRPTHPELLDDLARDFIRRGYSMKSIHRQLLSGATYRQSSQVSELAETRDPTNKLLSRMPLRRVDAEELRDAILVVSGEMNDAMGGPSEPVQVRPDGLVVTGRRRSVYVQQLRKHPPSLLESFDLPAMNPNCLQRSDSLVATQALHLWNDTAIRQLASRFAERMERASGDAKSIEQIYQAALGRPPSSDELAASHEMLEKLTAGWLKTSGSADVVAQANARQRAMATFCHTILNSAEFLYLD